MHSTQCTGTFEGYVDTTQEAFQVQKQIEIAFFKDGLRHIFYVEKQSWIANLLSGLFSTGILKVPFDYTI